MKVELLPKLKIRIAFGLLLCRAAGNLSLEIERLCPKKEN
jgi:hypothetical protein